MTPTTSGPHRCLRKPHRGAVSITADPGVTVDETEGSFTFDEEGVFNCSAQVDDDLSDSEVVVIDSAGPNLTIFRPNGMWGIESSVEMTGEVSDSVSCVPRLQSTVKRSRGCGWKLFNWPQSRLWAQWRPRCGCRPGRQGLGNQSKDVRSVLQANDFRDPAGNYTDGFVVRMWEGEGGLGHLESLAPDLMDSVI